MALPKGAPSELTPHRWESSKDKDVHTAKEAQIKTLFERVLAGMSGAPSTAEVEGKIKELEFLKRNAQVEGVVALPEEGGTTQLIAQDYQRLIDMVKDRFKNN